MSISNLYQPNIDHLYCDILENNALITTNVTAQMLLSYYIIANSILFNSAHQSVFNHYEELTMDANYTGAFIMDVPDGITLTRIGNVVQCRLRKITHSIDISSNVYLGPIPERFRPDSDIINLIFVVSMESGYGGYQTGCITLSPNGMFTINSYQANQGGFMPYMMGLPSNANYFTMLSDVEISWHYSNSQPITTTTQSMTTQTMTTGSNISSNTIIPNVLILSLVIVGMLAVISVVALLVVCRKCTCCTFTTYARHIDNP